MMTSPYYFDKISGKTERFSALPFLTNNLWSQVMADENLSKNALPWNHNVSEEKEQKCISLYKRGVNLADIAKECGFGRHTVEIIRAKHNLPVRSKRGNRPKTNGKEKEIIEMYLSGISKVNTGKAFGFCEYTIATILRENGIVSRPPGGSGEKGSRWKGGIAKDKKHVRSMMNNYRNERRKVDPLYKLNSVLRARINTFFRRSIVAKKHAVAKWNKSIVLLGATAETVKIYIELQFRDGMSWHNHGIYWHIDHRIPLASAKSKEELEKLFHYTNLQPLLVMENRKKSDKLNWTPEKMEKKTWQ